METFSTVLFVNHAPIGYRVHRSSDRAELNPAENPGRNQEAPVLVAAKNLDGWEVQGTDNPELIRQVVSELHRAEHHTAGEVLSAAP